MTHGSRNLLRDRGAVKRVTMPPVRASFAGVSKDVARPLKGELDERDESRELGPARKSPAQLLRGPDQSASSRRRSLRKGAAKSTAATRTVPTWQFSRILPNSGCAAVCSVA